MEPLGENTVHERKGHTNGCPGLVQIPVRHRWLFPKSHAAESLSDGSRHCCTCAGRYTVSAQLPRGSCHSP